jgi:hypothetical protein
MAEFLTAAAALNLLKKGRAYPGMKVEGELVLPASLADVELPPNLEVDCLTLEKCPARTVLPLGLKCFELNLSGTKIAQLPHDLQVESILNLTNCEELTTLPPGLTVGTLLLRGCRSLAALPEGLDVWFLDMTGCWSFRQWPQQATIRSGRLNLRGCTSLNSLPTYLGPLAALNVRDCPSLRDLPEGLRITGWIDLAQSGIAETKKLPRSLQGVDLRWQGVRLEERLLLHPETITVEQILGEKNAERRRVLLDRFGPGRFMQQSQAKVLDEDRDPGGPRQLLRVELAGDEPLVTLSCFCPSTQRQYFLRVPPSTSSCHQAAAWIAGFDNPAHYQPLQET